MPFDVLGKTARVAITGTQYALIKARPDGNCLFHAAGHLLERMDELDDDGPQDHAAFRREVVEYVEAHAKDTNALGFKLRDGLGIALNAEGAVSAAQGRQIDRRVAYLKGLTHWGDEACITAIERIYNVEALVYDRNGSLTSVDGIRYYTPSHAQDAKLRLVVQFAGAIPYHYDLFWPDDRYDPEVDGPDQTAVAAVEEEPKPKPKKPAGPRKAPEREWRYFAAQPGLKPYGPPIAHQQFAYTAAWLAGKALGAAPSKKPLSVALGGHENVSHGPPAPVVAVKLRNLVKAAELESRSFSTAAGKEALAEGYRERFFMPLQREGGFCLDLLDPSATELVIETEEGKAPQPAIVRGAIFQRVHGLKAAKTEKDDGLVADFELDLSKLKFEDVKDEAGARRRYSIPAATVFDRALARFLTWERSPYQLVIGSAEDLAPAASAWTYLHVPSEWDVSSAESVALSQVLMLDEDLQPLLDAGVEATAKGVANTALNSEAANGLETFELQEEPRAGLERVLAAAGLAIDWNFGNYLVEGADEAHYVSTSWASMAHLSLGKDGWYYMDALYCSGAARRAFRASAANVAAADERRAAGAQVSTFINQLQAYRKPLADYVANVDRIHQAHLRTGEDERAYAQAEMTVKQELIANQTIKPSMKAPAISKVLAAEMATRHPKLTEARARSAEERGTALKDFGKPCQVKERETTTALGQFHANGELQTFLREQKIPANVAQRVTWLAEHPWRSMEEALAVQKQLDAVYLELCTRRDRATLGGLELDVTAMVEGVKNFDTGGDKGLAKGADWKQFLFEPAIRVSQVVTCGISSCAGGVTFSNEELPSHVFLWHVDGNLSIPLRPELERLWPGGKGMPDLRSVVSINPTPWEMNKYRPENLYPAGTTDRCQTLFLPRSCHLYGRNTVTAGGQRFGLDLGDGQLDLVFTYDFDNRAEPLAKWRGALAPDLPRLLVDLQDNLYGAYRDQGAKPADSAGMGKYVLAATSEVVLERNAIKRRMRETWNKSVRVPNLCSASFEVLAKSCAPVLELDCFLGGEKGDVDLMDDFNKRWFAGSVEG